MYRSFSCMEVVTAAPWCGNNNAALKYSLSKSSLVFMQTTYRIALGDYPHVLDERIPLMVWISCSYTILSIVVSAMEAEKSVLGALSSRQNDCLATLIRLIIYSSADSTPSRTAPPPPPPPPSARQLKQHVLRIWTI